MVEECLPPGLMKAVVSKNKAISNGKLRLHTFANTSPQEQELFRAAYADKSMSLAQRERLSAAILQGDYSVVSPKSTSVSESEERVAKLRARDSAHRYRHEYNSGGLGVVSKSAALLQPEMKQKKAEQIKRCQSLGKGDMAYSWNRSQVPTVPVHVPPANHTLGQLSSQQFEVPEDYTSRKAAQEMYKTRGAAQVRELRNIASDWNTQYAEARRKQIIYRRKVVAFRQKLFERLRERNDPQTSYIMRTIDDHAIECFIDKFKGCAMSVDAIIQNLGGTLHLSTSNKCVGNLMDVPDDNESTMEDYERNGEADVFQFTASCNEGLDEPYCDGLEVMSLGDSSGGSSSVSRYRKLPKRGATGEGPRTSTGSPKKQLGMGTFGAPKRDALEFMVNPRPIVSRGAGFRSANPRASPESREKPLMGVGYSMSLGSLENETRPGSADSQKLLHAVKSQLLVEGKLQSEQPEKVLTEDELHGLASGDQSFEAIADSLSSSTKSSYRMAREPRQLGKVVIGSRKPPVALKTTHAIMSGPPDATPVPYKRQQHIGPAVKAKPPRQKAVKVRPTSPGDKIRPLSTTNYGGLYVISSYKDEHAAHLADQQPPPQTAP